MARARRKMRRKLIKQMKKGHLSAAERRELLDLDREVNKANREGAAIGAAGLGTALAIANKAGAGDALGEFLDKRQKKKKKKAEFQAESQEIGDKVSDQVRKDAKKELMDSLPGDKSDVRRSIDDISIPKTQDIDAEEENFEDEELNDTLKQYELQKAIEANPALAATLGQGEAPPSDVQPGMYEAGEGTTFDDLPKNTGPVLEGETEAEKAARRQRMLDARMIAGDQNNMEQIVGPGREQGFDDPVGIGAMPAGSGIPLRTDGPRVQNANGGYTPFLRSMRDRIRRRLR